MKTKRFLAILMVVIISISLFAMPTSAAEVEEPHTHIEVYFEDENLSEEFKEKATAYFLNNGNEKDDIATYGITCSLFGHKIQSTTTYTITHKARTTSPRWLKKTYRYDSCTRCDYEESVLISSTYIICCA